MEKNYNVHVFKKIFIINVAQCYLNVLENLLIYLQSLILLQDVIKY